MVFESDLVISLDQQNGTHLYTFNYMALHLKQGACSASKEEKQHWDERISINNIRVISALILV